MVTQDRIEAELAHPELPDGLGALAGGIAHDFNNLLVGVVGNADLARAALPEHSAAAQALQRITSSAQRASDLCHQLLAYAGQARCETRPTDLANLLGDLAPRLRTVTAACRVSLELEVAADLAAVDADPEQLQRALLNLVTHAAEAVAPEQGLVRVVATNEAHEAHKAHEAHEAHTGAPKPHGPTVRIDVIDDGPRMDDLTYARAFEPIFSPEASGRGLGLPAALGIARQHGGGIAVRRGAERGTTFELRLPARSTAAPGCDPPVGAGTDLRRGRVLVVDDEPMVRDVVVRLLERDGHAVVQADNGETALQVFREQRTQISLVVLDLTMPKMSGKVALRYLRAMDPELPVVLMSGYHESQVTVEPNVGPVGFVQKPFRRRVLLEVVRAALAGRCVTAAGT